MSSKKIRFCDLKQRDIFNMDGFDYFVFLVSGKDVDYRRLDKNVTLHFHKSNKCKQFVHLIGTVSTIERPKEVDIPKHPKYETPIVKPSYGKMNKPRYIPNLKIE